VVLTSYFLSTLSVHMPKLYGNMCDKETYNCQELFFKLQTCGDDSSEFSFDKSTKTLKMNELNFLLLNIGAIESKLVRKSLAHRDVIDYFNLTTATNSDRFVQPKNWASNYVSYNFFKN
jgi:hypothetical protein